MVAGDLGDGQVDEIDLRQVMTWRSEDHLREQLLSGLPMMSKESVLTQTHVSQCVGMRMPVGSGQSWLVRLGSDRAAGQFRVGDRLTVLVSEFVGVGGSMMWSLKPQAHQRWLVAGTKMGLALVVPE